MSPRRIDLALLASSKLIAVTIFFICGTLIICTGPLYIWIVITAMSGLTSCYNYKAGPISLLIIKHTHVAAFGLYRSWYPWGQYINYM
jgi:hypothetical protein